MLVAVTAFFGNIQHLHTGAHEHIVGSLHPALGKKCYKIFLFRFLDQRTEIIRADRQLVADGGKRKIFVRIPFGNDLHNPIADHLTVPSLRLRYQRLCIFAKGKQLIAHDVFGAVGCDF